MSNHDVSRYKMPLIPSFMALPTTWSMAALKEAAELAVRTAA